MVFYSCHISMLQNIFKQEWHMQYLQKLSWIKRSNQKSTPSFKALALLASVSLKYWKHWHQNHPSVAVRSFPPLLLIATLPQTCGKGRNRSSPEAKLQPDLNSQPSLGRFENEFVQTCTKCHRKYDSFKKLFLFSTSAQICAKVWKVAIPKYKNTRWQEEVQHVSFYMSKSTKVFALKHD